jgi:hypothetical protein
MRRRNKGNYEPYNTNNGENHCYSGEVRHPLGALDEPLAKDRSYVMGFDSETPLTPMSATASRPRFFAFMMCSQSKMVSGAGWLVRPFRNVLHDLGRKHQPLPFQWVTRVGLGARRRSVKYPGLCPVRVESATASGWLHDVGDRTSPRGRRVRLPDTANASPSPCEPRATSDLRPIAMPDAFLVRDVRSQAMHSRRMRAGWRQKR